MATMQMVISEFRELNGFELDAVTGGDCGCGCNSIHCQGTEYAEYLKDGTIIYHVYNDCGCID